MSCPKGAEGPTPPKVKVNILGPQDAKKDDKLQTNFGATIWGLALLALVGTGQHICANCATCSWEPLTMLNPQFVAG